MTSIGSVDRGTQTDEYDSRSISHSPVKRDSQPPSPVSHSPVKRNSQPPSPIKKETEHVPDSSDDDDLVNGLDASVQEPAHIETAVPVVARARMVTVPKRLPPSLPPRNPTRTSPLSKSENGVDGFENVSLSGSEQSDITLDDRKSDTESKVSIDGAQVSPVDETHHAGVNRRSGVAGEDEFHSVPPSPAKEHLQGIPGAF